MASKIIQRTLLVIALVVTAHLVKPFSIKGVTTYLLSSTQSFSFILPNSTLCSLERVEYLARVLESDFQKGELRSGPSWRIDAFAESGLMPPENERESEMRSEIAAKRLKPAKGNLREAKAPAVACSTKRVKDSMTMSLPIGQNFESLVAINLPEAGTLWSQIRNEALDGGAAIPVSLPAPQKLKCEALKQARARVVVLEEDAQQKLKHSIQRLLVNINSIKRVQSKSSTCGQKPAVLLNVKSS